MMYNVNCHVPDNADADRRMQGIEFLSAVEKIIREAARALIKEPSLNAIECDTRGRIGAFWRKGGEHE
jgi:hypothetical protein